ncbi:2-oxo-tetronate isomerase [Telmatospirillum siberiense]|uniref:Hydroxypyruvate isomerase n=1 Tax=Telmatospirillum siberiense TaxID=382514 RepID=A0A2N3PYN1_9PROT|nr:2-oxo-tetronate isomerase [Telmatospirillum siberiense]PKU25520.1 hydroxypyruvate isomerase [Telmatospirillum siberiense]
MPKFAANLSMMFNEVPFPERFVNAAKAGFNAVEFLFPYDYPPEEVAGWLKSNRLTNQLFNMPPGNVAAKEWGITSLPGREEEFHENVATALIYAKALGTPRILAMAGYPPAGADPALHHEVFVRNLRYAARQLAKEGLTLLIEPLNPRDMPGFFLNNQAQAHAIREEVGEPNLKVQMDFYHVQVTEGDVAVKIRKYIEQIGHIQIAGAPDRHEPDEGELNYRYLFGLLDELGYQGWVGCEYRPRGRTEDGLGWLERLTR